MERTDYYRAVLLGIVIGMAFISGFYVFTQEDESAPKTPRSNFTIIEQYKGCDVVQWHYSMLAEYKYFLHCPS
jgi:hypothetical protein